MKAWRYADATGLMRVRVSHKIPPYASAGTPVVVRYVMKVVEIRP